MCAWILSLYSLFYIISAPCAVEPCTNGGVCSVSGDSYICTCPAGIGGPECQYSGTVL